MAEVTIKAGRAYQVMRDDRRAELHTLRELLTSDERAVSLEITEYIPGRRGGILWVEQVAIYLGTAAGGALLSSAVNDVYDRVKAWAKALYQRKQGENPHGNPRPQSFTLYGPKGEVLKKWKIDKDGEHEE